MKLDRFTTTTDIDPEEYFDFDHVDARCVWADKVGTFSNMLADLWPTLIMLDDPDDHAQAADVIPVSMIRMTDYNYWTGEIAAWCVMPDGSHALVRYMPSTMSLGTVTDPPEYYSPAVVVDGMMHVLVEF